MLANFEAIFTRMALNGLRNFSMFSLSTIKHLFEKFSLPINSLFLCSPLFSPFLQSIKDQSSYALTRRRKTFFCQFHTVKIFPNVFNHHVVWLYWLTFPEKKRKFPFLRLRTFVEGIKTQKIKVNKKAKIMAREKLIFSRRIFYEVKKAANNSIVWKIHQKS